MRPGTTAIPIAVAAAVVAVIALAGIGGCEDSPRSEEAAGAGPGGDGTGPLVMLRALADVPHIEPGRAFHIAVVFDIRPTWHMYWKNPGVGAGAPRIEVRAPEGYAVGESRWPRPHVFAEEMGEAYGYEEQAVIFVPVTPPQALAPGKVKFSIESSWAVCSASTCKLENARCEVLVAPGPEAGQSTPSTDLVVAKFKARLPRPVSAAVDQGGAVKLAGGTLTIVAPAEGYSKAHFIPDYSPGVSYDVPAVAFEAGRVRITVPVEVNAENSLGKQMFVGGLVALGERETDPCFEFTQLVGLQAKAP